MTVTHLIRSDLLLFKAFDHVTANDFYAAWNEIRKDGAFQTPIDTLVDLREAQVDIPGRDIETIVDDLNANRFFNKLVIVADRGSFTYAMGRMFCLKAEHVGFCPEICLTMMEALSWLNEDGLKKASATHH